MRMAVQVLFEIDGTIEVVFHPAERALVGHWQSLNTSEFRTALEKAMAEAGNHGAVTWVVDLTENPGVPTQADLAWIEAKAVGLAKRNGIRAIVNVLGASQVARMGAKRWSKSATDGGISTYDCASLTDALRLAGDISAGRVG
jgi:hypothetical protein